MRDFFFKTLPSDKKIDEKISELHKAATEYLLSIGESDVIFLKNAQELNLSAFAALPELKIITHAYTCFVYDNILLEKKDTIENVLDDLKFVNNPQTLNIIGKINADNYKEKNILLESFKIKYINQYINQHFNL